MSRARNPATKERLLDAAIRLMLAKGYTATGVEEICTEAGVTKGSFFHYFESKDGLAIAALDRFWRFQVQMLREGPFATLEDPLDRVFGYLDFFIAVMREPETPKSCLVGNLTQELSQTYPEIRSNCEKIFSWHTEMFRQMLDEAKKRYAPTRHFDPQSLSEYFISVFQGSLILSKAKQDAKVIEENLQHFKKYIHLVFENEGSGGKDVERAEHLARSKRTP